MRVSAAIVAVLATGVIALPVHPAADINVNTNIPPNSKDTMNTISGGPRVVRPDSQEASHPPADAAIVPENKAGAGVTLQHNRHIKRIFPFLPAILPMLLPGIAIIDKVREENNDFYWGK
jgi:hypothetical protein